MARLTHTFFLLCIGCVLASVLALQPPDPASAFTSGVTIQVSDFSSQETYYGTMFHDTSRRAQLIDVPDDSYVRLQRWDLGREYDFNYATHDCSARAASSSSAANMWGWLSSAAWKGNYQIGGVTCQQWEYTYQSVTYAGCFATNIPMALAITNGGTKIQYYFQQFQGSTPAFSVFAVPAYCPRHFRSEYTSDAELSLRQQWLRLL